MLPTETETVRTRRTAVGFGAFTFDRSSRLLRRGASEIALPPRVLGVLELLVERAGDVVSRQELIDNVWNEAFVTDTSLAEAVSFLRQALGDDRQAPTYIQTIHRRGYRFVAPVVEADGAARTVVGVPASGAGVEPQSSPSIAGALLPWSVAGLCAVLAAAALWQFTHLAAPNPPVVRVRIDPSPGTTFDPRSPALAIPADATAVAWSGCDATACRLYVRDLDRLDARAIAGTEDASAPFFSPDGRWIGFFAGGKIKKVARAGGLPVALTDAPQPFGAAWLDDGHIVFASSAHGGLLRVSDRGGEAETITTPSAASGEIGHAWPSAVPGGRALLFTVSTSPADGAPARIAVMALAAGGAGRSWRTALDAADAARPVTADYIAYSRGNELHAVAFDPTRLAIAGAELVAIGERVTGGFAASAGGALAYLEPSAPTPPSLEWLTPPGGPPVEPALAALREAWLSPDALRVAGVEGDQTGSDIRVGDVARGVTTRLTHGGLNVAPVWSGDSATVFYASSKGGPFDVWARDGSGVAPARAVLSASDRQRHVFPTSVSRDGSLLAYEETGGAGRGDIGILPLRGGRAQRIVETPFDEMSGMLSPDGRMLAYQSDESGRWEIYLMRIGDRHRSGISTGGGTAPFWSPDGGTLHYRASDRLVSVAVDQTGDHVGAPVLSAPLSGAVPAGITPDGRILLRRDGSGRPDHAVLTLEWIREVRRMLGPPAAALPR
jgi:serine/threonine-protein kinase